MTSGMQKGLTSAEVADRISRGLVNRVVRSDSAEYREILFRNLFTVYNTLVVPAAITLLILGEYKGGLAVSGMALANLLLGLNQELRAKRLLEKLALLTAGSARVIRNGTESVISSHDIVQDDVLLLGPGEPILADGTVLEASALEVDEALLTGESDPIPRQPNEQVLSGGFCVAGMGSYRADKVGKDSFAQKTGVEARSYHHAPSVLQQNINQLIRTLTATAVALSIGYIILYLFTNRIGFDGLVRMIAATLTSLVPQGLVLMTTFSFLLGALRLSHLGALVQQMNSVETMASIDTLCMDKTGTLTTNQLEVQKVIPLDDIPEKEVRHQLSLFVSAMMDPDNKSLAAIRKEVGTVTVNPIDYLPFKSQNRFSAVRIAENGNRLVLILGAFETLKTSISANQLPKVQQAWEEILPTGYRLLLLAESLSADTSPLEKEIQKGHLRPVGLIALSDQLRPDASEVLQSLASQGIGFKIISGDNPSTVQATLRPLAEGAREPGIRMIAESPVVTGEELDLSGEANDPLIRKASVFGRVSPWQKVGIIKSLQRSGSHLAMMGDGVNDVLSIKNADLGIAMGSGSRASKTVAGLVLTNDDVGMLPKTLDEGRIIVRNLRRIGKLLLSKNISLLMLIIGTVGLFSLPFPFLPQQVTLLNLLTNGLPVLLLALGRDKAPSSVRTSFFRDVGGFAFQTGIICGIGGMILLLLSIYVWEMPPMQAQTVLLTFTIGVGLVNVLRLLHEEKRPIRRHDIRIWVVSLGTVPFYFMVLHWQKTASFFQLWPLDHLDWQRISLVFLPTFALLMGLDIYRRKNRNTNRA